MAGKGRQSWEKRQREKSKRERQDAKRADRADRKTPDEDEVEVDHDAPSEAELYERFAKLSEAHANGSVDAETFEEKRAELFDLLGLETH